MGGKRGFVLGAVFSVGLGACAGQKGDGEDTGGDACTSVLVSSHPEDGASDVYPRTVIDAVIGRAEPDATITLTDASGNPVPGTLTHRDTRIVFTPDAPLTAGETYTSLLDWSCEDATATFTVGTGIGDPVDPAAIVDRTYLMDLTQARYAYPPRLGDAMLAFLQAHLLLAVDEVTEQGIQFSAGSALFPTGGEEVTQDLCSATTTYDTEAAFSENPYFTVALDRMSLEVVRDDFVMTDLTISGTFAPDGSAIHGVSIDGILDAASLVTELQAPDAAGVCNTFSSLGVDCTACPGTGDVACIPMVMDSMTLTPMPDDLVPRTRDDIDADPGCATAR